MTDTKADIQQVSEAVATSLRNERKRQRLSLDEVARRSGVSKGMVVEIEKGTANPSIGILCKIAVALGLSVADMVNISSAPPCRVIPGEDIPTLWSGPLGGSARLLAGTSGPTMLELWEWQLPPGEAYASTGHPPGTLELFYVRSGCLRIRADSFDVLVPAGSSAIARTDFPHEYLNGGSDHLSFTMTVVEPH